MGRRATGQPNGRPRIIIDWAMVERCVMAGCSGVATASAIGCHPNTLYQRCILEMGMSFCEYFCLKKAKGDAAIRIAQFQAAVYQRNVSLLIWLGKQRLGQTNNGPKVEHHCSFRIEVVSYTPEKNQENKKIF